MQTPIDHDQNFWHLASIQGAAVGITDILIGGQLALVYGARSAFMSVCIGNLLLWALGLAVIQMTPSRRANAIENIKSYLGKPGAAFTAGILLLVFLIWFSLQIRLVMVAIGNHLSEQLPNVSNLQLRVGAACGLLITLLSIKGIRIIKWICVVVLPFSCFYIVYNLVTKEHLQPFTGPLAPSLIGIAVVLASRLAGMINLPTFFRHAKSKEDAIFGLSLMTLLTIIFQSFGIPLGLNSPLDLFAICGAPSPLHLNLILTILFAMTTLICINLVNIYLASAAWETIISKTPGSKEYTIIGLGGTAVFTFVQAPYLMSIIETTMTNFIASLGIVLLIDFITRIVVKHRPRSLEKLISIGCWIAGCILSLIFQFSYPEVLILSLFAGVSGSAIAFFIILFIEETTWSLQALLK